MPEKTGTATVIVNIRRSQSPPVFVNNAPYSTVINRGVRPGDIVFSQTSATDADLRVCCVLQAIVNRSYSEIDNYSSA